MAKVLLFLGPRKWTLMEMAMAENMPNYRTISERTTIPQTRRGRAWQCGSGEHRYHRLYDAALWCADPAWTRPLTEEEAIVVPRTPDPREGALVRMFTDTTPRVRFT